MSCEQLLLITGVPGMGKTTTGISLAENHGFTHIDFELEENFQSFLNDRDEYIQSVKDKGNVVITWGFRPFDDIDHINYFVQSGFRLIWFDGNRVAAFREFMRRSPQYEEAFYNQMRNIMASGLLNKIDPIRINTFDKQGLFRTAGEIIAEILVSLSDKSEDLLTTV